MTGPRAVSSDTQAGMALLVVVFGLALVSAVVMAISNAGRVEVFGAANLVERVRLDATADAGLALATRALVDTNRREAWPVDGRPVEMSIDGAAAKVSVTDVAGLIDLNTAPVELLGRLLVGAGLDPPATALALAAIRDWTDADDRAALGGDERSAYRRAGLAYGPRNAAMESPSELRMVAGFPAALYPRILPFITVNSGLAGIDGAVAPAEVLASVPGIDARTAASLVTARQSGAGGQPASVVGTRRDYFVDGQRQIFAIDVAIGASYRRRTVIALGTGGRQSWQYLAQYDLPRT